MYASTKCARMQEKLFFAFFGVFLQKVQVPANQAILMPEALSIAHLKVFKTQYGRCLAFKILGPIPLR